MTPTAPTRDTADERHPRGASRPVRRRRFLAAASAGAALVAGCLGDDGDDGDDGDGARVEQFADFEVQEPTDDGQAGEDGGANEDGLGEGDPGLLDLDWAGYDLVLEDAAEDLESLHEDSDRDDLQIVEANAFQNARPPYADEETDPSRFQRTGADLETDLVYGAFDGITGLRAEAHYDPHAGTGETTYAYSTDDGESWTTFEPDHYVYDDEGGDWDAEEVGASYDNVLYAYREFPEGVTHVRVTLGGGDESWTPQLGRVELYE